MPSFGHRHSRHGRQRSMGLIGDIIGFIFGIIVFILFLMLLWHVISNGAYYGGKLGDGVTGIVDFVQAFFNRVVG